MAKKTRTGELRLHRDGYGFVITGKRDEEDIFVPARFIGDALHTDLVEVNVIQGRGTKLEGRIRRIIERRVTKLIGRVEHIGRHYRVISDDRRVKHMIMIPDDKLKSARHGQNVVVRIFKYPSGNQPMVGEIVEVLKQRGEEMTEEMAVIVHHQLPQDFPKKVLEEADACSIEQIGWARDGRRDLRDIDFVTIDGENARDFDDAVAVEKIDDNNIRLWVSIADVSHFVKGNSNLDREAYRRSTSVYFPSRCLPMLPERLSNDLCSLKPQVDRLTITAELSINSEGEIVHQEFYPSVIRSRERMTYTAIKKILIERDEKTRERYEKLLPKFDLMERCFNYLRKNRLRRGSIDFDLPEPEFIIDLTGDIENIMKAERHAGHMMIEEFMIAANEAVAEFLTEKRAGCIYRVHEHPDMKRIHEFAILLHNLGYEIKIGKRVSPKALARVIDAVKGRPEERLVNTSLLRSMAQAVYSAENIGHYGLASSCYCHFTSPIRRYPDLIVHRLLKIALANKNEGQRSKIKGQRRNAFELSALSFQLGQIAEHCSRRERIAMEAEREMIKLLTSLFIQKKIGEVFDGIVSHVTKFGLFVELKDYFVEGLIHVDLLPDDRYRYNEGDYSLRAKRTKKIFRIGDKLRVKVEESNITNREIFFSLA